MTFPSDWKLWLGFHLGVLLLLVAEWLMAHRVPTPYRRALWATLLWVLAALTLGAFVAHRFHAQAATAYLAGYALEEALSVDNLFVFLLLFRIFQIPEGRQQKVLFWGVTGAIVLRGLFIAGGLQLLARFTWITYVFGAIILVAAIRLLEPESPESNQPPRWLYVLLAGSLSRLRFLHYGLAATLGFAAVKVLGEHWFTVGPLVSLAVIVLLLSLTVAASLLLPQPQHLEDPTAN